MVTKVERKLLNAVIKETYKIQQDCHPDDQHKFFPVPVDNRALGLSQYVTEELYRATESLDAKGYLMKIEIDMLPKACVLTFAGEHYKEMTLLELL